MLEKVGFASNTLGEGGWDMDASVCDLAAIPDEDLVRTIIEGENRAIEYLLIDLCGSAFKRLCITYRSSRMDVEDLAQEMCELLARDDWQALRRFRGVNAATGRACSLKTYVISCAARHIKRKSAKLASEIDWSSALLDDEGQWLEVRAEQPESAQIKSDVVQAIMTLSNPRERFVLLEYKLRGRPAEEVAALLGEKADTKMTVANVHTICSRAIKNLRILFQKGDAYA